MFEYNSLKQYYNRWRAPVLLVSQYVEDYLLNLLQGKKSQLLQECPTYLYHITNNQWKPNITTRESIADVVFYGVHIYFFPSVNEF